MDHYSTVQEPWWDDRPLVVIGGGPSLKRYDIRDLRQHGRVVALNDAMVYCKADIVYSIDANWQRRSQQMVSEFEGEEVWLAASKWIKPYSAPLATPVKYIERVGVGTFSLNPDHVHTQGNSGYSILNLAYLKRAKEVYLLGYDMNEGSHSQWHEREEELGLKKRAMNPRYYQAWPSDFQVIAPILEGAGMRVVNCNPDSAVKCFEFSSYEDFGLKLASTS